MVVRPSQDAEARVLWTIHAMNEVWILEPGNERYTVARFIEGIVTSIESWMPAVKDVHPGDVVRRRSATAKVRRSRRSVAGARRVLQRPARPENTRWDSFLPSTSGVQGGRELAQTYQVGTRYGCVNQCRATVVGPGRELPCRSGMEGPWRDGHVHRVRAHRGLGSLLILIAQNYQPTESCCRSTPRGGREGRTRLRRVGWPAPELSWLTCVREGLWNRRGITGTAGRCGAIGRPEHRCAGPLQLP